MGKIESSKLNNSIHKTHALYMQERMQYACFMSLDQK